MRYLFRVLCVCVLGAMELTGCGEATVCENDICPCTEGGILDAIAAGGGPYTFDCGDGMTVVTQAEIVIDNDVILDGERKLTVDGNADHSVFLIAEDVTAELRGITVTRGRTSNTGQPSGGINNSGTLTLTNSTVSGNSTAGDGGGIRNIGTLTLVNSTVLENRTALSAGGGIMSVGTLTLINSTVSGNTAGAGGGGIWSQGPLTMTDSAVSGNAVTTSAGGLFLASRSEVTLTNSTVSGNSSGRHGGGIENDGTLTLTNSTISGNTADDRGGGIYNVGRLSLNNTTLSGNSAGNGGGIHNEFGTLTATNTVVDGDCFAADGGASTSNGYNIESPGNTCGFDQVGDQVDVTAVELNLGPLQDNGGPTQTHALLPGSVAIDVIPEVDCVDAESEPLTTDQRGQPRPGGTMCDVGAFEVQP